MKVSTWTVALRKGRGGRVGVETSGGFVSGSNTVGGNRDEANMVGTLGGGRRDE